MCNKCHENGFVLPYVLTVIAILALAGTIAMGRLQKSNQTLGAIASKAKTERMIDTAETISTFVLLGALPVNGGYDLNPEGILATEFGFFTPDGRRVDRREAEGIQRDVWFVTGDIRRIQTDEGVVYVSLQDVSGLPSLNAPETAYLAEPLIRSGANRRDVDDLVAKLADYIDTDSSRQQNGAEHFDYRLKNMRPPSNSPLRSYEELFSVIGWNEVLPSLDMTLFQDLTTLQTGIGYRPQFSPSRWSGLGGAQRGSALAAEPETTQQDLSALSPIFGAEEIRDRIERSTEPGGASDSSLLGGGYDPLTDGANRQSLSPSRFLRLTFWAQRNNGEWDKRVVELMSRSGHISKPFRRNWVYETTVAEPSFNFANIRLSDLAYVIDPASIRP